MRALDVLGDPVRRRIVELLAHGERDAGTIAAATMEAFSISRPAVSQHLRILLEGGVVVVRPSGRRRLYRLEPSALLAAAAWLNEVCAFWQQPLDALATEVARGKRRRREAAAGTGRSALPARRRHG